MALATLPAVAFGLESLSGVLCLGAATVLVWYARQRAVVKLQLARMAEREAELQMAALIDTVTGLKNRTAFSRDLEFLLESDDRAELAVLFLDLDRFKEVNDTRGHKVGDELLKGVASRLRLLLPPGAILARIGGDEFAAIVRPDPLRPLDDLAIAIVEAIYEPFMIDGHLVHVGASVGLAKGLEAARELGTVPVAVNVSPIQFRHHGFATIVSEKLIAAALPGEALRIEITEGVLISHLEAAKSTIRQLRQIGVKLSLDDFGTGYSRMSYRQNHEVDYMMIDMSFIRDL